MSEKSREKLQAVWGRVRAVWRVTLGSRERVPIWVIIVAMVGMLVALNAAQSHGQRVAERKAAEHQAAEAAAAASAEPVLPPWDQQPTARLVDTLCAGHAVVTVGGTDYEIIYHNRGTPSVNLIAVEHNQRAIDAGHCDDDGKGQAQSFRQWDHHTGGCVLVTRIDARDFIVSTGWGMIIPEPGRLAGPGESPADACAGRASIVPPIEDAKGYAVDDETWECGSDQVYIRALRQCFYGHELVPGEDGRMRLK